LKIAGRSDDLERLAADRTGRAEDEDLFHGLSVGRPQ
jgi:hypothetical protein